MKPGKGRLAMLRAVAPVPELKILAGDVVVLDPGGDTPAALWRTLVDLDALARCYRVGTFETIKAGPLPAGFEPVIGRGPLALVDGRGG